jgi:hypothetical protein
LPEVFDLVLLLGLSTVVQATPLGDAQNSDHNTEELSVIVVAAWTWNGIPLWDPGHTARKREVKKKARGAKRAKKELRARAVKEYNCRHSRKMNKNSVRPELVEGCES